MITWTRRWARMGCSRNSPRLYAPFQKLIETMKYKLETPEQAAVRTKAQAERTRKNVAGWLDSAVLGSLKRQGNEEQMEIYTVLKEAFLSGEAGSVEQVSAFKNRAGDPQKRTGTAANVLANTVRQKDYDGRISRDNKAWAQTVPVCEDKDGFGYDRNVYFVVHRCNSGLTDLFLSQARRECTPVQEQKPSVRDSLNKNAGQQAAHSNKTKVNTRP